ncbi:MAG: hypothetical protein WKF79_12195 [Nocardioides sp.]
MATVPRHRYRFATGIIVLALFAAGCGGGDEADDASSGEESESSGSSTGGYEPGDGTTPAPYPCDQLTADEIGTLLGGTYTYKEGPQGQCDFDSESTALPTAYVRIDQFKLDFPTALNANPGAIEVDVAMGGFVADDPASEILKNGYAQLTEDGVALSVTLAGGEQADRDEKIEELLALAASKL